LDACIEAAGAHTEIGLKVVIFDDADYAYAQQVARRYPQLMMSLQVGNPAVEVDEAADLPYLLQQLKWLSEKFAQDHWQKARVLPQLHVLAWGNERAV